MKVLVKFLVAVVLLAGAGLALAYKLEEGQKERYITLSQED